MLRKMDVNILSKDNCRDELSNSTYSSMAPYYKTLICAKGEKQNTRTTDSCQVRFFLILCFIQ